VYASKVKWIDLKELGAVVAAEMKFFSMKVIINTSY